MENKKILKSTYGKRLEGKSKIEGTLISYDIKVCPDNYNMRTLLEVVRETGFLYYDSSKVGEAPKLFVLKENKERDLRLYPKGINITDINNNI